MEEKYFFNAEEFNQIAEIKATNCLAFAFGQFGNACHGRVPTYTLTRKLDVDTGRPLDPNDTPVQAFIEKAQFFGINVKEVSTLEETEGKTSFLLWGWYLCPRIFGGYFYSDFHVVRKNLDGSFEHKPDFYEPACRTTLEEIKKEYPETPYIFVVC